LETKICGVIMLVLTLLAGWFTFASRRTGGKIPNANVGRGSLLESSVVVSGTKTVLQKAIECINHKDFAEPKGFWTRWLAAMLI